MTTLALEDRKEVDLQIKAEAQQAMKQIQTLTSLYQALEVQMDKVNKKAKENNMTISQKDITNVRNQVSQMSSLASSVNDHSNHIQGSLGSGTGSKEMQDISSQVKEAIEKGLQSVNYNKQTQGINPGPSYQQLTKDYTVNPSKNFNYNPYDTKDKQNEKFTEENRSLKAELNNFSSDIHNTQGSARRTGGRIETSIGTGRMSYERKREYEESFKQGRNRINEYNAKLENYQKDTKSKIEQRQGESSAIGAKISSGTATQSEIAQKNVLDNQIKQYKKVTGRLSDFSKTLENSSKIIKHNEESLTNATGPNGGVKVNPARNSVLGRLRSRSTSIGIAGVNAVATQGSSMTQRGIQNRQQSEQYSDPILFSQAQGAGKKGIDRFGDRRITNSLDNLGIRNGTGYQGTDMAQFAGAYSGSTGKSNYSKGANAWSKFSRYSGAGQQNTLSLETAIGESGAGSHPGKLSRSIMDNIAGSGMQNRVSDQVQGLTGIIESNNEQGISMSRGDVANLSAMQGIMAKNGGSNLRGTQGARALAGMGNAFSDDSADTRSILMAQNGSERYAGIHGAVNLKKDELAAKKDPSKLLKGLSKRFHGDTDQMALYLNEHGGMNINQAEKLAKMGKSGKFSQKQLGDFAKKNRGKSNKNKKAYDDSANKINNEKQAQEQRNDDYASESTDDVRRVRNTLFRNSPHAGAAAALVGGAVGSITPRVLGSVVSPLARSTIRGISHTKLGGRAFSHLGAVGKGLLKWGGTKKPKGIIKSVWDSVRGKSGVGATGRATRATEEAVKNAGKGATHVSVEGVSKGASKIAVGAGESATKAGAKGIAKGGLRAGLKSGGKGLLRGGSKILGKVATPLQLLMTGADVYNAVKHNKKGSKGRATGVGSALGEGGGTLAGAAIGSAILPGVGTIAGGIIGSVAGHFGGKGIGSWWHKHQKRKSAQEKSRSGEKAKAHKKNKGVLSQAKSLLKGFNDMLDKAMRVIAEAKTIKGGDNDDSSNIKGEDAPSGSGAKRWTSLIKKAAKASGEKLSDADLKKILSVISGESNGNEKVINNRDDNAKAGHPSKGLLQFIDSTFDNYKVKGHGDIMNGYDQLLALFNDSKWRSDLTNGGWSPVGAAKHARGGIYNKATMRGSNDMIGEAGIEAAVPLNLQHANDGRTMLDKISPALGRVSLDKNQVQSLTNHNGSSNFNPTVNINVSVPAGADGNDIATSVQQGAMEALQQSMQKMTNYYGQDIR